MIGQFSLSSKKKRRSNSVRKSYVTNPYPSYHPPKENASRPAIIKALVYAARNTNPARNEAWYTTPRINLKTGLRRHCVKRMNEHRARAINALMVALSDRVNIVSGKVEASVEQLSDWCGLSTGPKITKSISRASRALTMLEELGAVKCQRVWDDTSHAYIPKIIWITELFFVLIDYELGKFLAAQDQQLIWENKKLREKGEASITLSEARRRAKEIHIKKAFKYRTQKKAFNKQHQHAQKLICMEHRRARTKILNDLIKMYSQDELEEMGYKGLRRQVDHRYHALRKLALSTLPPPPKTEPETFNKK